MRRCVYNVEDEKRPHGTFGAGLANAIIVPAYLPILLRASGFTPFRLRISILRLAYADVSLWTACDRPW